MDKFLFTDGITGVKQAQSAEELELLIESSDQPDKIRVWIYNSSEWMPYAAYRKVFPAGKKERSLVTIPAYSQLQSPVKRMHWAKKFVYLIGIGITVFLVLNFTKIKWQSDGTLSTSSIRPANVPEMDIDSLITTIEEERGQPLDRSTRTNLRLRNSWPDRIMLQATADKETSSAGTRFYDVHLSIDNTTGFPIDQAVVRLIVWKNNKPSMADSFQFSNIHFDKLTERESTMRYKGDSISVDFQSIRSKAFNFSYSSALKNEPGMYNDRWFSKD